jgi:hypothetical protein
VVRNFNLKINKWSGRSSNFDSCIYNAIFLPIKLRSRGLKATFYYDINVAFVLKPLNSNCQNNSFPIFIFLYIIFLSVEIKFYTLWFTTFTHRFKCLQLEVHVLQKGNKFPTITVGCCNCSVLSDL